MSRFSKAEAELRGWLFTHNAPAATENLGDGIYRTTPADLRAEKIVDGHVFTEQAETIGKLLERIHLHERSQQDKLAPSPEPVTAEVTHEGPQGDVSGATGHGAEQTAPSALEEHDTVKDERESATEQDSENETEQTSPDNAAEAAANAGESIPVDTSE